MERGLLAALVCIPVTGGKTMRAGSPNSNCARLAGDCRIRRLADTDL